MPKITILPHPDLCPKGATLEASPGDNLCSFLLDNDIYIEHACEMSCACTTCHVYIRQGKDSLEAADDLEEDQLDKAWGLGIDSRLSCQIEIADSPLTIEIPKYSINHAKEN